MANHTNKPKYPHIQVKLVGREGNAFSILARMTKALIRHGVDDADVRAFRDEATSGDYNHLLATVMRWVDVR